STADIDRIGVDGELHFSVSKTTLLYVDTIITGPGSKLTIGSHQQPVGESVRARILIHRDNGPIDASEDPSRLSKGIVTHGIVRIAGQDKADHLKVAADSHPRKGDNSIFLDERPYGWVAGDLVLVTSTNNTFVNQDAVEYRDEIVKVIAIRRLSSERYRVEFAEPLQFDHVPPAHRHPTQVLRVSVANLSRNVTIGTSRGKVLPLYSASGNTIPVEERGHLMFMHNDDVSVQNAAFVELGRTDKSKHFSSTNVPGRYALHFHRTGVSDLSHPAVVEGNVIFGSPGWGMVHHDANVNMVSNVIYGVLGSGMVAEAGNETGVWSHNLVAQTHGRVITFNAEQSSGPNGPPVDHPAYQAEIENNSFMQGEAYGMKSRLLTVTHNIAAGANGAGFSFWPHGSDGPSHIGAHSRSYQYVHGYNPFFGQDSVYPGKVPTRIFFGNEVYGSRHALNTSANKIAHRHDMDVMIEDLLSWNTDMPIMSFYQENYIIKDSVFIRGQGNVKQGYAGEGHATHIHDPVDFKMINNYWEGFTYITKEPIQIILGNRVVGASTDVQSGPTGLFRQGATADNDEIDLIDNSTSWRQSSAFGGRSIGTLSVDLLLNESDLSMTSSFDRFSIVVNKTDTLGTEKLATGSQRDKKLRGANQKNWWIENAKSFGYYLEPNGKVFLMTEGVFADRVSGTVGSIEVAIHLEFIEDPETDFPEGSFSNGPLPETLDTNGVGTFKIVDRREFGKSGNLLSPDQIPHAVPGSSAGSGNHDHDHDNDHGDMGGGTDGGDHNDDTGNDHDG
ncbi:MAG: G8 domain-containing protein, partial [Pseudomonadota bacterium]